MKKSYLVMAIWLLTTSLPSLAENWGCYVATDVSVSPNWADWEKVQPDSVGFVIY